MGLKLVDSCHQRGIAVFLDVVYNHVGKEAMATRRCRKGLREARKKQFADFEWKKEAPDPQNSCL